MSQERRHPETGPLSHSIEAAAKRAGAPRSVMYELVASGQVPARRIGARKIVLDADLVAFLESQPIVESGS